VQLVPGVACGWQRWSEPQNCVELQSLFVQQVPVTHPPPQHTWSAPHWLLAVQAPQTLLVQTCPFAQVPH
jgi:hypothetical protein